MHLSVLLWVGAASLLGFIISVLFSTWMKLRRHVFLVPYFLLVWGFLIFFYFSVHLNLISMLVDGWYWGLLLGGLISVLLIKNVRSQPASQRATGKHLTWQIAWAGMAYGVTDALFLNVLPVVAVRLAFEQSVWPAGFSGKVLIAVIALAASLLVTLGYHLGYVEFRGKSVLKVVVGNALITLPYLLSGSVWGAILAHTIMHIAAVLHGPETTIQLPPHPSLKSTLLEKG